jgi:hypothetical protein
MKNSTFNTNRPPLSDEEINESKNFDEFVNKFGTAKKNSFYKKVAVGTGIVALLTVGAIVLFDNKENQAEVNNKVASTETIVAAPDTSVFKKPINGLDVSYQTFKLDANKSHQFTTAVGTVIDIPEQAFLNDKGNPIEGEIELKFREFHDVVSIFAAGIPMTYDSAGTQYHFESAGMFEILAYSNGQLVNTNPTRLINVTLASQQQGGNFNLYYLENNTTWNFIKKDTAKGLEADSINQEGMTQNPSNKSAALKAFEKADKDFKKALQTAKIIQPQLANNNLFSFKVDYKASEFPELVPYKNILFEITEKNKGFDPAQAKKEWKEISLTKTDEPQVYKTDFYRKDEQMTLWVRPVFSQKDIKTAETTFDKLFEEYDQKNNQKLSALLEEKKELFELIKAEENSVKSEVLAQIKASEDLSKMYESQRIVKRVFEVENFGMWNSDCPQNLPKGEEIEPLFVNETKLEDTLTFTLLYMAEMNKNALYSLYGNWGNFNDGSAGMYDDAENFTPQNGFLTKLISFNPKNKTVMWGITKSNQLALIKPMKMEKIKGEKTVIKVEMEIMETFPKDISSLKKILGF